MLGMHPAGIILCGGESRRMGYPKAWLPFGAETLLQRTAKTMSKVTSPLVVVSAIDQSLPELPPETLFTCDSRPQRGPLEGIRAGLAALPADVEFAYVTSCDVPYLTSEFVRRMVELLGQFQIAVPEYAGFRHPMAAVYRRNVLSAVEDLLANDRLRPMFLFDQISTRTVSARELDDIDPQLQSLQNLNSPEEYKAALAKAGFALPEEIRRAFAMRQRDQE